MENNLQMMMKKQKRRKIWLSTLGIMMCIVVFCTTYALILPAITMEPDTWCGKEEHEHEEKCFQEEMICQSHTHGDECYARQSELICAKEEEAGHLHTDACAPLTESILSCGMEESAGHTHTEECEPKTEKNLVCEQEEGGEHTHSEPCYTTITTYGCGLPETEGHTHDDTCYTPVTTYGCGLEETAGHTHGEECYSETTVLTCELEAEEHEHTEACYENQLICEKEEHTHSLACYSDPTADVETAANWEATLPDELTGVYAQDVLKVAESQLGYTESIRNYIVSESGEMQGYTRYGEWYGNPYGDWCAMFASFCLHYAGVEDFPLEASCSKWVADLTEKELYREAGVYEPQPGDLVFFNQDEDEAVDHVGIVEEVVDTTVTTIEGNSGNRVEKKEYDLHDNRIVGYGLLNAPKSQKEEVPAEQTQTNPEDTDAWAELVIPETQVAEAESMNLTEQAEENAAVSAVASTYSLRKTSAVRMTSARAGTSLDLKPYISGVVMYDYAGNIIPSDSLVTEGDNIEFRIEYAIPGQQLGVMDDGSISVNSNTLTYSLPSNILSIMDDSGEIINHLGQTVGEYVIDGKTKTLTMTFTDDYVEQNAKGIQIHGFISFFSTVVKSEEGDHEDQDYQFTDNITLGVQIEEKIESVGNLKVKKNKLSVVGEDLVYELIVESTEGTKDPVTITDQMSAGLTFVEGLEVTKGQIGDTADNGTPVTGAQFQAASDKKSFTLTLPPMEPGEAYTVIYQCKADVDLLGADMTVQNTATVSSKDSQDHDLKDRTTVSHTFDMLKKEGVKNEDGTISWTITINQAKADISGWILDDFMNGNQHFTGTVTVRNSRGGLVAQNVTLPYTFPQNSKDTYTVTYTTEYDYNDGSWVTNKAVLRDNNTTIEREEGVEIGSPIEKSGVAGEVIEIDGKSLLPITWTVSIDTSLGPIEGGAVLNDIMSGYGAEDMYMTAAQIQAAYDSINDAVMAKTYEGLQSFTAYKYVAGSQEGSGVGISQLVSGDLYERFSAQLGNKGIPQSNVPLTFTYQAYGVFPNGTPVNSNFANRFNIGGKYEVVGTVRYSVGGIYANKAAILYFDPSKDYGDNNLWWNGDLGIEMGSGSFDQVEYEKLHDGYLSWIINIYLDLNYNGKEDVVIYEDIPEGLTICDVSYYFTGHVPTTPVRPKLLIPGRSEKVTFTMYPGPEYLKKPEYGQVREGAFTSGITFEVREGAFTSGITFEVTESGDLKITVPSEVYEALVQYNIAENEANKQYDWYKPHVHGETFLNIHTRINDDFAWTTEDNDPQTTDVYVHKFENRFTIESESGKTLVTGSQTQEVTKNEKDAKIRKEAKENSSNNLVDYSVVLNAYGRDLIPNSDTLHITDVMTYVSTDENDLRVRLVPGSVRLYEVQMHFDGTYTKLKDVTPYYKYDEASNTADGTTTWTNTITMDVPDGKALVLEYRYLADGIVGKGGEVGNTCTISGVGDGGIHDDGDIEIDVKEATAQADMEGITLCKVDNNSDGIYLEDAVFHLYIWNKEANDGKGDYIQIHKILEKDDSDNVIESTPDFVTDSNGQIVLSDETMTEFAYNTAYKMVEVRAPDGYILDESAFLFQIVHENKEAYVPYLPEGFDGASLTSGDIIYRENTSGATEITVEKYWQDMSGQPKTVYGAEVSGVSLKLWQKIEGNSEPAVAYGIYEMTPDYRGNWKLTIKNLPKETENNEKYLYYLEEVGITVVQQGNGYALESTENNDGINSGTIILTNKQVEGYVLPETGGAGTQTYTTAGLMLVTASMAFLLYRKRKRRREDS